MTDPSVVRLTRGEEGLGGLPGLIARRSSEISLAGPDETFMRLSGPFWNLMLDRYFRLESSGWERLPAAPTLVISVHAGVTLTMDAWSFVLEWWRHFGPQRVLHGTSHDVLLALPGLGDLFRHAGVIPASARGIGAALAAGHDVVLWPGGERDSMRTWTRRDKVELAGPKGFVRQAIRSGVPIVPVATVGGSDTAPVLFDGHWIAKKLGGQKLFRAEMLPVVVGPPFGIALEALPMHFPLPAKIRFEVLDPIEVDHDPDRTGDKVYVQQIYDLVESRLQSGVDRLARKRRFPLFG